LSYKRLVGTNHSTIMQTMKITRGFVREDGLVFLRRKRGVEVWVAPEAFQAKQAASKAYREANKEKRAASGRAYRAANKEKIAASAKAYCEANKEKVSAKRKAYYQANKDKCAKATKAWYLANKDRHFNLMKAWFAANQDRMTEWKKAYYEANKDKFCAKGARRRALQNGQTPSDAKQSLIQTFYDQAVRLTKAWSAPHIDRKFRVAFAVDHIVPLSRGGLHEASNLQVIPAKLNARKKDKLNYPMPLGYANSLQFSY
jgi:hypothetical protein